MPLTIAGVLSAAAAILAGIPTVCAVIGAASVVLRAVDALVEKMIVRRPNQKIWATLDRMLDRTDPVLGWVRRTLDAVTFDTSHRSEQ